MILDNNLYLLKGKIYSKLKKLNYNFNDINNKYLLNLIYDIIEKTYNLKKKQYYLINLDKSLIIRNDKQLLESFKLINSKNIKLKLRINGGNPIKIVFGFITKIFKPLVSPLAGIGNAFLFLIKGVIYMAMLALWIIKFMVWFFTDFLLSLPFDLITLIKRITYIIFDTVFGFFFHIIRTISNKFGNITIAALSGADNVPDESKNESTNAKYFKNNNLKQKCYRTSDGLIPFSVIIATILCPPIGVFMEYGLTGWLNILFCALLTLLFYFPGLIYALILLYC
jgi:uncharacterized membrane protein YqaE (UPF0057 family)